MRAKIRYATIQYVGNPGVSKDCLAAVTRLIQHGDRIERVRILSSNNTHCLLLALDTDDLVAVRSGFRSGYNGERPRTLSEALALLEAFGADIEELDVPRKLIERLDSCALTAQDLAFLGSLAPVRPWRWPDYFFDSGTSPGRRSRSFKVFSPVTPFAIAEHRLVDLAVSFWEAPDDRLLRSFRRLEDIVRNRIGASEIGVKMFSIAFLGENSKLRWKGVEGSEHIG